MRRLVWAFAGRTYHIVGYLCRALIMQKLDQGLSKLHCDDNNKKTAAVVARMLLSIMNVTISNAIKPNTEVTELGKNSIKLNPMY